MKNQKLGEALASRMSAITKDSQTLSIASSGRFSREIDNADEYLIFYSLFPEAGSFAVRTIVTNKSMEHQGFAAYFESNEWELIRYVTRYNPHKEAEHTVYQLWAHPSGILAKMEIEFGDSTNGKALRAYLRLHGETSFSEDEKDTGSKTATVDRIEFFSPMVSSEEIEKQWNNLKEVSRKSKVIESDEARLGMISQDGGSYYVKNFNMKNHLPDFVYPDLHYGENFEEFHASLLKKIGEETKGLILLHGNPGTGKTQYIRVLLNIVAKMGKSVLYVPPSFSAQLVEPSMIEFVSNWVIEEEKDCILLIEDAEPLLETRTSGAGRTTGISNLLNMTDGLLNDILGLTVIATFNTEISKIDDALLRPQRLLARKEFGKISEERATELAKKLNVPLPKIDYPATLAEFYAAKKSSTVLIHEVKQEKKIGFRK